MENWVMTIVTALSFNEYAPQICKCSPLYIMVLLQHKSIPTVEKSFPSWKTQSASIVWWLCSKNCAPTDKRRPLAEEIGVYFCKFAPHISCNLPQRYLSPEMRKTIQHLRFSVPASNSSLLSNNSTSQWVIQPSFKDKLVFFSKLIQPAYRNSPPWRIPSRLKQISQSLSKMQDAKWGNSIQMKFNEEIWSDLFPKLARVYRCNTKTSDQ
jgi:hypothetical protein